MLEQTAKAMQDRLGFRVESTNAMGEPGCRVTFQDSEGRDASVQPVANEWPWEMWEHLREVYLLLEQKDKKIADLEGTVAVGQGRKSTHINTEGDIVVNASLPTENGSEAPATKEGS